MLAAPPSRIKDPSNRSSLSSIPPRLSLPSLPPPLSLSLSLSLRVSLSLYLSMSIKENKNSFPKARVSISGRHRLPDRAPRARQRRERPGDRGARSGVPRREQALQAGRHEAKVLGHSGHGLSAEQRGERGGRRELSENAHNGEPRDPGAKPHSRGPDER